MSSVTSPPEPARAAEDGQVAGWAWSDAWVLAAIMLTGMDDGATLADVVAAADAINHAILTEDEVQSAVRRLLGAGLITTSRRRFSLTDSGRSLARDRRVGMLDQVDRLLGALHELPVQEEPWQPEPGELRAAVRRHGTA